MPQIISVLLNLTNRYFICYNTSTFSDRSLTSKSVNPRQSGEGKKESVMKIQASLVSMSKGQKRAMVTVTTGEGAHRRSTTRHIGFTDGAWFGHNPDERAVPLNRRYTAELLAAKGDLAGEQATLTQLEEELLKLETTEPTTEMDTAMIAGYKAELAEAISEAKALVNFAEASVAEAELKLHIVEKEVPLEVEFGIF